MASVLRRYLSRELLQYWVAFTLVLWLVLIAARLSLYLGQAAGGELPADAVLLLLGLKSVGFLVFLMPFSLFLALLYLLGRLNQDYESLAMAVAGAGPQQLYRMLALPVLTVTLLVAVLSGYLVPHTAQLGYDVRARAEQQLDAGALTPGRFHRLRNGRWLVFARGAGAEPGSLADVFVYVKHPQRPQVLVAEAARVRAVAGGERYLVLHNGYRYDGQPGQADYRVLRYREYALRLQASPAPQTRRDALSTARLWRDASPAAHAELHGRLARPLSVLVLGLIALPLGRFRAGVGRHYPMWLGVLVFALYFNLLGTGQLWIEQEKVPVWVGLWWVHALMIALCIGAAGQARWLTVRRAGA